MKLLIVLGILITTNTFASNEQLEAILKQYEPTLTNHQVGMKSLTLGEGISFIIDDEGVITTQPYRNEDSRVILKVDGSKIYEYVITKDLSTGEQYIGVNLSEQKYESDESINYEILM